MNKNAEANEGVLSFFNDTVFVTKKGNIAIAEFVGSPISNFQSGSTFVPTTFLDNYPDLKPIHVDVLGYGLIYKSESNNYIAIIEVDGWGKLSITFKDSLTSRSKTLSGTHTVYGILSWITA